MRALGGWLFARRGWLPVPLAVACLWFPTSHWLPGALLLLLGEAVRLAAVGHIGLPSRTRDASVGPLVDTGPYARVRNPLYVGNILLWTGLGVMQWPAVWLVTPLLCAYYQAIVLWEEGRLTSVLGAPYVAYLARVPRWLPTGPGRAGGGWSAARALRTERGTLVVLFVVLAAVYLRGRVLPG